MLFALIVGSMSLMSVIQVALAGGKNNALYPPCVYLCTTTPSNVDPINPFKCEMEGWTTFVPYHDNITTDTTKDLNGHKLYRKKMDALDTTGDVNFDVVIQSDGALLIFSHGKFIKEKAKDSYAVGILSDQKYIYWWVGRNNGCISHAGEFNIEKGGTYNGITGFKVMIK